MLMTARIYGFVALVLLLAAGGDLLVVDFASSFRCDGSGSESETLPEDDCFCCCAHIDLTTSEASTPVPTRRRDGGHRKASAFISATISYLSSPTHLKVFRFL